MGQQSQLGYSTSRLWKYAVTNETIPYNKLVEVSPRHLCMPEMIISIVTYKIGTVEEEVKLEAIGTSMRCCSY